MKIFNLIGTVTISVNTQVKANTLAEAKKIALDRDIEAANFQGTNAEHSWISDEYDGEVQNIHEED